MKNSNSDYYEFIRLKIELFASEIEHAQLREHFKLIHEPHLDSLREERVGFRKRAMDLDRDIESIARMWYRLPMTASRATLRSKFGLDRLGKDPSRLIPRVLKRGKIVSDAEAEVVKAFVDDQTNEAVVGTETYSRLAEILDEAGY